MVRYPDSFCALYSLHNIPELDGGRKPSCKWPHPMSDNSTRRDMPTGTFLTSLLSKTSLEMWRALLAGRKSRRMPTQGQVQDLGGAGSSVEPFAPDHIEECTAVPAA
jgi:hypothetical protein